MFLRLECFINPYIGVRPQISRVQRWAEAETDLVATWMRFVKRCDAVLVVSWNDVCRFLKPQLNLGNKLGKHLEKIHGTFVPPPRRKTESIWLGACVFCLKLDGVGLVENSPPVDQWPWRSNNTPSPQKASHLAMPWWEPENPSVWSQTFGVFGGGVWCD